MGLQPKEEPREDKSTDAPFPEEKKQKGEYSVPDTLNPEGFYAIQVAQAEMYDLGNIAFIPHFILYDRKQGIAIDVTSDVRPAPLLSETRPAEVIPREGVDGIEKYLTGEVKPEITVNFPSGVRYFVATELSDACYIPLRTRMVELRDARLTLDAATNAFREQAKHPRTKNLPTK